ncbi:hypothetical protein AQUCO_01700079v1 [Aquilegia coerulea]|uniref:Uncharacterized protein n=1 Tax=Aquilegia coerulea TaxID=218851 RepID=A0A2G5DL31_AQUCA|nr:hypothetical protein AQUCO_01700079v1 [Aquilegia coerulea]
MDCSPLPINNKISLMAFVTTSPLLSHLLLTLFQLLYPKESPLVLSLSLSLSTCSYYVILMLWKFGFSLKFEYMLLIMIFQSLMIKFKPNKIWQIYSQTADFLLVLVLAVFGVSVKV